MDAHTRLLLVFPTGDCQQALYCESGRVDCRARGDCHGRMLHTEKGGGGGSIIFLTFQTIGFVSSPCTHVSVSTHHFLHALAMPLSQCSCHPIPAQCFWMHFAVLTHSGPGDTYVKAGRGAARHA